MEPKRDFYRTAFASDPVRSASHRGGDAERRCGSVMASKVGEREVAVGGSALARLACMLVHGTTSTPFWRVKLVDTAWAAQACKGPLVCLCLSVSASASASASASLAMQCTTLAAFSHLHPAAPDAQRLCPSASPSPLVRVRIGKGRGALSTLHLGEPHHGTTAAGVVCLPEARFSTRL